MSLRHRRLILLLATTGCAVALLCPMSHSVPSASLGPLISAAPPLFTGSLGATGEDSPLIAELRREADLALGQLRARQ